MPQLLEQAATEPVPHHCALEEERSRGEKTVENTELSSHFLPPSVLFLSIFPSLPQAKEIGEKRNAGE